MTSFEAIRQNFRDTFRHLFSGGEANLWLADPEDPLESPVEIHAAPRGKRTQRIDLLSGGERALTALSLLFGIYLVKPSPLCVLDEVDAPLDESNIGRFIRLLQGFKSRTQFVVITHKPPHHRGGGLDIRGDDGGARRVVDRRRSLGEAPKRDGSRDEVT